MVRQSEKMSGMQRSLFASMYSYLPFLSRFACGSSVREYVSCTAVCTCLGFFLKNEFNLHSRLRAIYCSRSCGSSGLNGTTVWEMSGMQRSLFASMYSYLPFLSRFACGSSVREYVSCIAVCTCLGIFLKNEFNLHSRLRAIYCSRSCANITSVCCREALKSLRENGFVHVRMNTAFG